MTSPVDDGSPRPDGTESADAPGWSTMLQALTDLGRHGQRVGSLLAARTGSDDGEQLARLISALPPASLGVDFDPANLVINGYSIDNALKHLAGHVISLRARDGVRDLAGGRGVEVQLGRGSVDIPQVLGVLEENHYSGFITVDRTTDDDPILECAQAIEFLHNMFQ